MVEALRPGKEDIQNFLIGGVTVGAAFSAYKQVTAPKTFAVFILFGLITLFFRELGQRVVAHWMEADVSSELSREGAVATILVAAFSYVSVFNLAFLVPVFSEYSNKRYEHWGKGIDAIWAKREYWLAASGITTLLLGWFTVYSLGFQNLAELTALFTFFQLLPLDEEKPLCGQLDGAYIIMWTGFMWLIFMGTTIIAMILSVL
ncbi:MAG: hypothetical protein ABEK16_03920 [Candidatus Nanohalobium sp.]